MSSPRSEVWIAEIHDAHTLLRGRSLPSRGSESTYFRAEDAGSRGGAGDGAEMHEEEGSAVQLPSLAVPLPFALPEPVEVRGGGGACADGEAGQVRADGADDQAATRVRRLGGGGAGVEDEGGEDEVARVRTGARVSCTMGTGALSVTIPMHSHL